jgi:hypothetical protein
MARLPVLALLSAALVLLIAAPLDSRAADPPAIVQVIVIDTNGDNDAFLSKAQEAREIFKRLGIDARRRYMQASLAGEESGNIALTIDYPSLKALAEAGEKLSNDAQWQAYVQWIGEKGMSVVSNSVWVDRTP